MLMDTKSWFHSWLEQISVVLKTVRVRVSLDQCERLHDLVLLMTLS